MVGGRVVAHRRSPKNASFRCGRPRRVYQDRAGATRQPFPADCNCACRLLLQRICSQPPPCFCAAVIPLHLHLQGICRRPPFPSAVLPPPFLLLLQRISSKISASTATALAERRCARRRTDCRWLYVEQIVYDV